MNRREIIGSVSTGFENRGKMLQHFDNVLDRSIRTPIVVDGKEIALKPLDMMVYNRMVKYSFGYMNDIRMVLEISIKQLQEECGTTNKPIIASLKRLVLYNLIERIRYQDVGPKQTYKYKVVFTDRFRIDTTQAVVQEEEEPNYNGW